MLTADTGQPTVVYWNDLIQFVASNFNLKMLTLTVSDWRGHTRQGIPEDDLALGFLLDRYHAIIKPLEGFGAKGLKRFIAPWPMSTVDHVERRVMEDGTSSKNTGSAEPDAVSIMKYLISSDNETNPTDFDCPRPAIEFFDTRPPTPRPTLRARPTLGPSVSAQDLFLSAF